jgi:hypothetical protein
MTQLPMRLYGVLFKQAQGQLRLSRLGVWFVGWFIPVAPT